MEKDMAKVKKCKNCGKELAGNAITCPDCGGDQRSIVGRNKILTVIGVIVLLPIIIAIIGLGGLTNITGIVGNKYISPQESVDIQLGETSKPESNEVEAESIGSVVYEFEVGSLLDEARENEADFNQKYTGQLLFVRGYIIKTGFVDADDKFYTISLAESEDEKYRVVRIVIPMEFEALAMALDVGEYINIYMRFEGHGTGYLFNGEYVPAGLVRN
jgi:uncharacterized OB-fold protein